MQTYSHALTGAALGAMIFQHEPVLQIGCVIGSVSPDMTLAVQYAIDLVLGRPPMTQQGKLAMLLKEIAHSIPVWLLALMLGWVFREMIGNVLLAFALGGITHIIVDVLTHGTGPRKSRPYWDTDLKFVWPLPIDLRPLGLWEYRKAPGDLTPKPFELGVDLVAAIFALVYWFGS